MDIFLIISAVVLVLLIRFFMNQTRGFDDPKPMSDQHLLSAIAGQADCLERISAAPIETQNSPSIIEISRKRRNYMARLCLELLSRNSGEDLKYPGASVGINYYSKAIQYAKELEATGLSREIAAVRAVKEKLFVENGVIYPTRWEV